MSDRCHIFSNKWEELCYGQGRRNMNALENPLSGSGISHTGRPIVQTQLVLIAEIIADCLAMMGEMTK